MAVAHEESLGLDSGHGTTLSRNEHWWTVLTELVVGGRAPAKRILQEVCVTPLHRPDARAAPEEYTSSFLLPVTPRSIHLSICASPQLIFKLWNTKYPENPWKDDDTVLYRWVDESTSTMHIAMVRRMARDMATGTWEDVCEVVSVNDDNLSCTLLDAGSNGDTLKAALPERPQKDFKKDPAQSSSVKDHLHTQASGGSSEGGGLRACRIVKRYDDGTELVVGWVRKRITQYKPKEVANRFRLEGWNRALVNEKLTREDSSNLVLQRPTSFAIANVLDFDVINTHSLWHDGLWAADVPVCSHCLLRQPNGGGGGHNLLTNSKGVYHDTVGKAVRDLVRTRNEIVHDWGSPLSQEAGIRMIKRVMGQLNDLIATISVMRFTDEQSPTFGEAWKEGRLQEVAEVSRTLWTVLHIADLPAPAHCGTAVPVQEQLIHRLHRLHVSVINPMLHSVSVIPIDLTWDSC